MLNYSQETNGFATLLLTLSSLPKNQALPRHFDNFFGRRLRLVDMHNTFATSPINSKYYHIRFKSANLERAKLHKGVGQSLVLSFSQLFFYFFGSFALCTGQRWCDRL
jgi:hypothetical protein